MIGVRWVVSVLLCLDIRKFLLIISDVNLVSDDTGGLCHTNTGGCRMTSTWSKARDKIWRLHCNELYTVKSAPLLWANVCVYPRAFEGGCGFQTANYLDISWSYLPTVAMVFLVQFTESNDRFCTPWASNSLLAKNVSRQRERNSLSEGLNES